MFWPCDMANQSIGSWMEVDSLMISQRPRKRSCGQQHLNITELALFSFLLSHFTLPGAETCRHCPSSMDCGRILLVLVAAGTALGYTLPSEREDW